MTGLVTVFPKTAGSLRFAKVFFATMTREWHGIDKFRLDKYVMMFRAGAKCLCVIMCLFGPLSIVVVGFFYIL